MKQPSGIELLILVMLALLPLLALGWFLAPAKPVARPSPIASVTRASPSPSASPAKRRAGARAPRWRRQLKGLLVEDAVACPMDNDAAVLVMSIHVENAGKAGLLRLTALATDDGRELWQQPFPLGIGRGDAAACVIGSTVVVYLRDGTLAAYEVKTGRPVGQLTAPPCGSPLIVAGIDHSAATLMGRGAAVQIDARPISGSNDRLGDAYVATNRLPAGKPLAGGRGVAVVQDAQNRVHLIDVPGGGTRWSVPADEPLLTALVRMNYILLGGRRLDTRERATGKRLDVREPGGHIERLDERSSWLYVLHGDDELSILDLDTRAPIAHTSGAAAFDYAISRDYSLDRTSTVRALTPGSVSIQGTWILEQPAQIGAARRMVRLGNQVYVTERVDAADQTSSSLACYALD